MLGSFRQSRMPIVDRGKQMHKLSVAAIAGALFTLGASADSIHGLAAPDQYALAYLSAKGGRDAGRGLNVRVGRVEPFGRSVLVQTGDQPKVPDAGDFLHSKPAWNLMTTDVTHETDSFFYNGEPL